jgi:hypothetical protein
MEIAPFTTPLTDKIWDKLGIEYMPEFLTRARNKDDIVLSVPGYRQTKSYTCGFVSGMMVLHYFRPESTVKDFYPMCEAHDDWGVSTRKLSMALRKTGIKVSLQKSLTFEDIASFITEGRPIITSIKRHGQIQHWIVIYGVNRKTKELFVAGDKFWLSVFKTVLKWNVFRHRLPKGVDFLICWKDGI